VAYAIKTIDCKGDGATYTANSRHKVLKEVQRLLEHGNTTYGDKIVNIVISRKGRKQKGTT
jgi:lipopolysaccharide export system protein LptA